MPNHRNPARDRAVSEGSKWYFSGVPCKNGHVAERMVSCHKCRECDKERQAARRADDPGFRERSSERHKKWRAANPKQALENSRLWYENNKERAIELNLKWQAENSDAVRAIRRRYYKRSPKPLAHVKARQKRVRKATPTWSDMAAIRRIYENCPPGMQVDHAVPIKGATVCGLHVPWNLQYLTLSENASKGNRWSEWSSDGSDDASLFQ